LKEVAIVEVAESQWTAQCLRALRRSPGRHRIGRLMTGRCPRAVHAGTTAPPMH